MAIHAWKQGVTPDTGKCSAEALNRLIRKANGKTIELAAGRYDFYAENCPRRAVAVSNSDQTDELTIAVLFENASNVRLVNTGKCDFYFHGILTPLAVMHSTDIHIQGITIDWDVPLTAEGVVRASCAEYADVLIDREKYPYEVRDDRLTFLGEGFAHPYWGATEYDARTGLVEPDSGDRIRSYAQREVEPGVVRMELRGAYAPREGNLLALRHGTRVHPGMLIHDSRRVSLGGMYMYTNAGLGILSQFSEDLTMKRIVMVPRSAAGRRVAGGHDDGLHFSNVRGHIQVEKCAFYALLDDPINIHGTALRVDEAEGCRVEAGFAHAQSLGFPLWAKPGDVIGFIETSTMETVDTGTVRAYRLLDERRVELTLDAPPPAAMRAGWALENLTNTPSATIRHCHFGAGRARGLLVTTPRSVVIEENLFESPGAQILISGDANDWYESGACHDVLIRRNTFTAAGSTSEYQFGGAIISISPQVPAPDGDKPFHHNIRIEENSFVYNGAPILRMRSTTGLRFERNTIVCSRAPHMGLGESGLLDSDDSCTDLMFDGSLWVGHVPPLAR